MAIYAAAPEKDNASARTGSVPPNVPPVDGIGSSGNHGDMEPRIAKLETAAEYIQRDIADPKAEVRSLHSDITGIRTTDFRILFGAITTVAVTLDGLMAEGFGWIQPRPAPYDPPWRRFFVLGKAHLIKVQAFLSTKRYEIPDVHFMRCDFSGA